MFLKYPGCWGMREEIWNSNDYKARSGLSKAELGKNKGQSTIANSMCTLCQFILIQSITECCL